MILNDLIKRLQQIRKSLPGDADIRAAHEGIIEVGGCLTFDVEKNKIKNIPYSCYRCMKDPRMLSKDKKHKLCGRLAVELTVEECEKIRSGTL